MAETEIAALEPVAASSAGVAPQAADSDAVDSSDVSPSVAEIASAAVSKSVLASNVQLVGDGLTGTAQNQPSIVLTASLWNASTVGVTDFSAGPPEKACYLAPLPGVTDAAGQALARDNDRVFTVLKGDASGELWGNATDLSWIRGAAVKPLHAANLRQVRADVSWDGRTRVADLSLAKTRAGADARPIPTPTLTDASLALRLATALPAIRNQALTPALAAPLSLSTTAVLTRSTSTPTGATATKVSPSIRSNDFLRSLDVVLTDYEFDFGLDYRSQSDLIDRLRIENRGKGIGDQRVTADPRLLTAAT